ncbi:hypothetical protein KAJ27_21365, partial [bacterium]|nr:hypothetical protein [bacterium]
ITILAIGIVPVLGLYTSNIKNLISQKEEMISAYISKRIMETIRQFNANSSSNYDLLSMFNVTDKKIIDNTAAGDIFTNFEDINNPIGFGDELGISKSQYPELHGQLKNFTYSISVKDFVDKYKYNNYYGIGTRTVVFKDVEVKVTDPHKKKFVYRTILTRSGI